MIFKLYIGENEADNKMKQIMTYNNGLSLCVTCVCVKRNSLIGALLIRHASDHDATKSDVDVAYRWCCEQPLVDLKIDWLSSDRVQLDRDIVFQNFSEKSGNSKL
ncbi:hypothetical protein Y032_0007g3380 [Ancylostoma ceylanicum]|uniref:Acyl-CoA dehydrogenase 11-like C-terminal domain-containing protein n=1 Tax=Ancylostoma ceylanicum TaxID=53326 RepID=A0A016VMS2_9BILA|nr:hypothetical protein Y032_0007g3380 [Ancylostoma ceylanicum]